MALAKSLMNIPNTFADHDLVLEALNVICDAHPECLHQVAEVFLSVTLLELATTTRFSGQHERLQVTL